MKKISLFMLAVIASFGVMAQDTDPKPMRTEMSTQPRFGLRAGVNLASLEIDDENTTTTYNTNSKTTFHLGAFVNVPIGGMFRFQPEISYVGQGSKITGATITNPSLNGSYELDMHYIAVPLIFQLQTNSGFFVEAGPQIAFLIKAEEDLESGNDADVKDTFRKTDFGLSAGLGYLSRIGLGLNARYVHGLSNVYNQDDAPASVRDAEVSNRGVQIGLVYHFGAHK
jgi:hypothetical protein